MIVIGADVVPTSRNFDLFADGNADALVGDKLREVLYGGVYRIFNLEVPLTDEESPIKKCGPNLIAPAKTAAGLRAIKADLVTLANNHMLDQGTQGLYATWKALEKEKIACVGAGDDPVSAARPYYFTVGNKRVGVYGCAEHEFSIVSEQTAGANPYDPLETPDHIAAMKRECDYSIVLYHGGKEHHRYPSPGLQKICRKLIDKGADLVICQHSHCVGCEEKYHGGTIVYGQGNFLFDRSDSEFWQTGLLVCVDEVDQWRISYIPLRKTGATVRMAEGEDAEEILNAFAQRSEQIQHDGFVERQYSDLADTEIQRYLAVLGYGRFFRILFKLFGYRLTQRIFRINREGYLLGVCNYVECEAHRELVLKGIKQKLGIEG